VVLPLNKKIMVIFAAICIALILGVVIYNFTNLQIVNHDSNQSPTEPTSPENQTETEVENVPEPDTSPPVIDVTVPDDYPTIQQAVNCASDGDTVFVRKGQYNETVTVYKSLFLLGEDNQSTIIDANSVGPDLLIIHDNVNVTGFTIRNTPAPPPKGSLPFSSYPTQDSGIEISNVSHCFIYRNYLTDNARGVCIENSSQICVTQNEFGQNYKCVELVSSTNNHIMHNVINGGCTDFAHGIIITSSTNNYVVNNTITGASAAIALHSASENTFRDNKLTNNYMNFAVTGNNISSFINNVDTSNTLDGKPIYYWIGKSNEIVPSDAACIVLVNCKGIIVQDFELVSSKNEIVLANTNNSIINCNKLAYTNRTKYTYGERKALEILVFSSFDNEFISNYANFNLNYSSHNRITHNMGLVHLTNSTFNNITENHLAPICFLGGGDRSKGVYLINSSHNWVEKNNITGFNRGIKITESSYNNTILGNKITDHSMGIECSESPADGGYNIIFGNNITDCDYGIALYSHFTRVIGNTIMHHSNWGIVLGDSVNCCIIGNVIDGLHLGERGVNTQNCSIIGNNITNTRVNNQLRIFFRSAYPGTFYHNNFLYTITMRSEVSHIWDNGSEGNYWSDYNGTDSNGDGIGDTPYIIDENNQDNYPLMYPVKIEFYQNYPE
jgi:parallel beta-helix repeat protein